MSSFCGNWVKREKALQFTKITDFITENSATLQVFFDFTTKRKLHMSSYFVLTCKRSRNASHASHVKINIECVSRNSKRKRSSAEINNSIIY